MTSDSPDGDRRFVGVVLAGGHGRRMGGCDKAFLELDSRPLVAHVLDRLARQVDGVVISTRAQSDQHAALGWPVCPDEPALAAIGGPLVALVSSLAFVRRTYGPSVRVVSTPVDTPLWPLDFVQRLDAALAASTSAVVAYAASGGRDHPLSALWAPAALDALAPLLRPGRLPGMHDIVARIGGVQVPFAIEPVDPFLNVNTPEQLAAARQALQRFGAAAP